LKPATARLVCYLGVGLTLAAIAAEFASFYLHLFVLPVLGMFPLIVLTLAPALLGVAVYQRATKPK